MFDTNKLPNDRTWVDISSEEFRDYIFPEGVTYHIDQPVALSVDKASQSHRIVDAMGYSHYIPFTWIGINWVGDPHFIF